MRYFLRTFAALALVAVMASGPAAPAWADVYTDFSGAQAAQRSGNFDLALRLYTKVIESGQLSGKNLAVTYSNRGIVHKNKRQYDRAIADYTRAIEIKPNYADAYYNRGIAYDDTRRYDRAIADYTRAIELKPNLAMPYNNRGNAYRSKRQYHRAIADFTKAIELKPDHAFAYFNRAQAYEKTGRKDLAIADYRAGQRLAPNDPDYTNALKRLGATP